MSRIRLNSNKTIKFLSIAIAILLWSYVMGDINPITVKQMAALNVNVNPPLAKDLVMTSTQDLKVNVKISGRRSEVYNIQRNDLSFDMDISSYDEGSHKVKIEMNKSFEAGNVDIDYEPKEIELKLEKIISEYIPVELETTGKFPAGLSFEKLELETGVVRVTGVRSKVDSISKLIANLEVSGLIENQTIELEIIPVDSNGNEVEGITLSKDQVGLKVLPAEIKKANIVPKLIGSPPEGYKLLETKVSPAQLSFKKTIADLNISTIETENIDISKLTANTELKVKLKLPEGIEILGDSTVTVSLKIEKLKPEAEPEVEEPITKILEYEISSIQIQNLAENLELEESLEAQPKLTLELKGKSELLNNLKQEDIVLGVDFGSITEAGEYSLKLNPITIKEGVELLNITPDSIKLSVKIKTE